jgi:hypothetical protein
VYKVTVYTVYSVCCNKRGSHYTFVTKLFITNIFLVIALRPQTPKHIRGGWSHYTDTSEPVDKGVGTQQL